MFLDSTAEFTTTSLKLMGLKASGSWRIELFHQFNQILNQDKTFQPISSIQNHATCKTPSMTDASLKQVFHNLVTIALSLGRIESNQSSALIIQKCVSTLIICSTISKVQQKETCSWKIQEDLSITLSSLQIKVFQSGINITKLPKLVLKRRLFLDTAQLPWLMKEECARETLCWQCSTKTTNSSLNLSTSFRCS